MVCYNYPSGTDATQPLDRTMTTTNGQTKKFYCNNCGTDVTNVVASTLYTSNSDRETMSKRPTLEELYTKSKQESKPRKVCHLCRGSGYDNRGKPCRKC